MKKFFSGCYVALVLLFMYLPIFVLIMFSFNETKGNVWTGFSFKWYNELIHNELILTSALNTLLIAIVSALVSAVVGTAAAFGMHNMKKISKNTLRNATYLQNLNPEIVTGISLMLLFTFFRMTPGYVTLIMALITFCLPTVVLSVLPKLRQMNVNLYEAAMDLGCNRRQAFFKVVLPEIMPGVVTGTLMALTYSIDDFVISYFTSGPQSQTLPITIYSMTKKRISPEINALSTILFVIVLIILVVVNVIGANKEKEEERKANAFSKK
jgi:spermidine/putrescine transport system permease protein